MKAILLIALVLPISAYAFIPSSPGDSPITKIVDEDLRCEDSGAMFAIKSTENSEKVWQSDPGMDDGIEMSILRFDRFECPFNFYIETEISMFGQVTPVTLKVSTPTPSGVCKENQSIQLEVLLDGNLAKSIPCHKK
ncbi:MAG: hypothetical protein KDD43_02600 [Bdellovibrionales bacterium]|nr:hypothetical protein [Bdellovibrionales bacterium]